MTAGTKNFVVVHVGLGKTATTTLQRQVFPLLQTAGIVRSYNDERFLAAAIRHHLVGLSQVELDYFAQVLRNAGTVFVSNEGLSNWDPARWEASCDRNLELFGREATIVLTLREPASYLASVYAQHVQEGNVKAPHEFFLRAEDYALIENVLPRFYEAVFAIDRFDLAALEQLYASRFARVVVVTMEQLKDLEFLRELYGLEEHQMIRLRGAFAAAGRENVSYSKTAMRMTFMRERFLFALGMKSIGTTDFDVKRILRFSSAKSRAGADTAPPRESNATQRRSYSTVLDFFLCRLKWTWLMQRVVDQIVPYVRYTLPPGIIPQDVIDRNAAYYERCRNRSLVSGIKTSVDSAFDPLAERAVGNVP